MNSLSVLVMIRISNGDTMNQCYTPKCLFAAIFLAVLAPTLFTAHGDEDPDWQGLVAPPESNASPTTPQPSSRRSSRRREVENVDLPKDNPVAAELATSEAKLPTAAEFMESQSTSATINEFIKSEPEPAANMAAQAGFQLTTDRVLLSTNTPAIDIKVIGSKEVEVGQSAHFQVVVANSGNHDARGLFIRLRIPESVEVQLVSSTGGEIAQPGNKEQTRQIVWQFDVLRSQSQQRMDLQLLTSAREDFQIQAEWTVLPVNQSVDIQARQPELALSINAPPSATYGEQAECSIVVTNSGNGTARNVVSDVALNGIVAKRYEVEQLDEGNEKTFSVALAELPAGDVKLTVTATGDPELRKEAVQTIVVNRPELNVVVEGPQSRTAGTRASYKVRVTNSGTLSAVNIHGVLDVTSGVQVIQFPDGVLQQEEGIVWNFDELLPGEEKTVIVQCVLPNPGTQSISVGIVDAHGNRAESVSRTLVKAKANVHLTVESTQDTLAVGDEVTYELYLENSGSRAADQVSVVAQLPKHLEVVTTDGLESTIESGAIRFKTIPRLAAGETKVITIRTKAAAAGTDPIYVELATLDPDKRIAYESKADVR